MANEWCRNHKWCRNRGPFQRIWRTQRLVFDPIIINGDLYQPLTLIKKHVITIKESDFVTINVNPMYSSTTYNWFIETNTLQTSLNWDQGTKFLGVSNLEVSLGTTTVSDLWSLPPRLFPLRRFLKPVEANWIVILNLVREGSTRNLDCCRDRNRENN